MCLCQKQGNGNLRDLNLFTDTVRVPTATNILLFVRNNHRYVKRHTGARRKNLRYKRKPAAAKKKNIYYELNISRHIHRTVTGVPGARAV